MEISNLERTNKTNLSEDELIIFDVLFASNVPIVALKGGDDFSLIFNYCSHNLDIDELVDTINSFVSREFVHLELTAIKRTKRIITFVGLTEKGGKLWEEERGPDWEKYVIDSSSDENGVWELTISSPSLETAKDFIITSHECKLYELKDPNNFSIQEMNGRESNRIVPWKAFNRYFQIKTKLSEKISVKEKSRIKWDIYNRRMRWWRNVEELKIIKKKMGTTIT